jgi:hypothetical protein
MGTTLDRPSDLQGTGRAIRFVEAGDEKPAKDHCLVKRSCFTPEASRTTTW